MGYMFSPVIFDHVTQMCANGYLVVKIGGSIPSLVIDIP